MSVSTQHDVSTKAEKSHVRSVHSVKTRVAQEGGVDTLAAVIISTAAVVRPARTGKVRNAMRPMCVWLCGCVGVAVCMAVCACACVWLCVALPCHT